jgi:arylsulfatase A-like enzyme
MSRLLAAVAIFAIPILAVAKPPNIVLVLTDDQGYGDLGCHGNPGLKTPNMDRFASQAVEGTHFYVSPVCAPTRASLMTGFYNYRTGVVDTYNGRALMRPDVTTLAQRLKAAGYRTGLFGKWHLGDNYPLRPQDRGFQEVLMHRGGGIGQPSDPPGNSYFKPILEHNGKQEKFDYYCTDVFTDAAMRFIEEWKDKPFFVYLSYNCPHAPLQTPAEDVARYAKLDLSPAAFPAVGQPFGTPRLNATLLAKLYGMETNLDTNFGRLLAKLDELKLAENTIVIFMSDNGPQEGRYNAGLRGLKGTVYEGGIRVPFFMRWSAGGLNGGRKVDDACAHIDIVPTLLGAAVITRFPPEEPFDGQDLLPLFRGETSVPRDRTLFFQWHRGDVPEKFRACAVRESRYKLVQAAGEKANAKFEPKFELFDIPADPYEQHDLAEQHPEVVSRLKAAYERWFADVTRAGFAPGRPQLGTPHENPTRLTRQDWRGPRADRGLGYWEVNLPTAGTLDVTVTLKDIKAGSKVHFRLGDGTAESAVGAGATTFTFRGVTLPAGDARLEAWIERDGESKGVWDVEVRRTGPAAR